jgi:hypothetical protein
MEVQVSKGFLVLAQNTDTVDYIKQAYALALSIKYSQSTVSMISLVTNDKVPKKYKSVFDQIIPIPFGDSILSTYRAENRWKLYYASPYDETIILDTDMLLLDDVSSWWNYCEHFNIRFCSNIKNYKLETVVDTVYRKAFISNNLSNPYYALHYFKKSDESLIFYKALEFVCNNWEWAYSKFAPVDYQSWLSMDLASAIAIEISGMQDDMFDTNSPLHFVHMKTPLQSWPISPVSWQDTVPYVLTSRGDLIVGNIKQPALFHYVEKNFLTDSILDRLTELADGRY